MPRRSQRLPTERPAHFRNERRHFKYQPRANEGLGEIKPVGRVRTGIFLAGGEQNKDENGAARAMSGEREKICRSTMIS